MKTFYRFFTIAAGVFFLYYFIHLFDELPKIDLVEVLSKLNYFYIIISLCAYLFSHILRAIRFAILLGRQDYSIFKLVYLQFYTNAINLIFPFKLGEVYRIVAFNKLIKDDKKLILTVITEKTLDLLLLFVWAMVAILFLGKEIVALNIVLWILLSLIIGSLILFFVLPENIRTFNIFIAKRYNAKWTINVLSLTKKIMSVITNIKSTLRANVSTITLLTFSIWIFEVIGFCYLLPFMLEKSQVWLVSILVFLSSLIPSASLGLGGLQLGFSSMENNTSQFNTLIISLTYQAFIFAPAVVFGFILYLYVSFKKDSSKQFAR
jgi:hypothetical protein